MTADDSQNAPPDKVRLAAEIYEEHGSFIRTIINCRVKDEHLRKDIYHDFFLALMQKPLPEGIENIRAYIYRAVCNEINDSLRKLEKYKKHLSQHNLQVKRGAGHAFRSDDIANIKEVNKLFELVETKLAASQASVINFKHKTGLSNTEIAERLNISNATVSTYYSIGLRKLREIVKKEGELE